MVEPRRWKPSSLTRVSGEPRALPLLPAIALEIVRDRTDISGASGGFLDVRRVDIVMRYPDGSRSETFPYDTATRRALDAVVVVAHARGENGERMVYLRSALRPPLALREIAPFADLGLWEVVAGLIEPHEDPRSAAVRELEEELGAKVDPTSMLELGPWTYPAPGMIGERHVFFHVEVDPKTLAVPGEDGSVLERDAMIVAVPLRDALLHVRRGDLRDAKTEIALRRLAEL